MAALNLRIQGRGGKSPIRVSSTPASTTEELFKQVAAKTKLDVHRIGITSQDKKKRLDNDSKKTLASYDLHDDDTLLWKDLGPQISWRNVFLTEYFGPLVIHPLFYFYGHRILYQFLPNPYGSHSEFRHSKMQRIAFGMVMAHYIKRELETLFVHRFSHATMPIFNLFKNSAYYWGLSGILLAAPLYGPWAGHYALRGTLRGTDEFLYPALGIWLFAQASNFACHWILRQLRPANDPKKRQIPRGYGFEAMTCPNYFFEQLGWLVFSIMTLNPFSFLFWAVGTLQMAVWAKKKHRNYKKEFGAAYPKRWIMIPGLY